MRALTASAVALLCACGGLDNRPLTTGSVVGHADGCDSEGVVGIVGDSSVRVAPDGACTFRIDGLEPGPRQLYVAPTGKKVALVAVSVEATKLADVGEVTAKPGAFARVQVTAPGSSDFEGEVIAPELPISTTALGRSGMARVGPFPSGCYRLEVTLKGFGKKSAMSCLGEGEEKSVDVAY